MCLLHRCEFGVIYKFKFPVEGGGELLVATTRPETMLGDTAVAIHSTTEHHKQYHNRHVIHPLTGRRIPIIIDDVLVNPEMGTGVVKVGAYHVT